MAPIRIAVVAGACAALLSAAPSLAATASNGNWPAYGGDPGGARYSTLTQIDKTNVSKLQQVWRFDMPAGSLECQPIVIDGVLYAGTTDRKVIALDAATGAPKWTFSIPNGGSPRFRGVSWWANGSDRRVLVSYGSYVYALNADTGRLIPGFGQGGMIDLRRDLRGPPESNAVNMSSPPAVYEDVFITHGGVGEVSPASPGDIRGWDVRTGKLLWTFHTIPHPGEKGYETWPKDAWKTAGGANAWTGVVVDEKTGVVFAGAGSPTDDFWGGRRIGDDLYGNSLLALDARTGKLLWHFQAVRHDLWDSDFAPPPVLMTVTRNGRKIDAVAATNKLGFVYLLDRRTGKSLFDLKEVAAPPSDVPGERAAETQLVPTLPYPLGRQVVTADTLTNRSPEANAWARQKLATMRVPTQKFTPVAYKQETIVAPGFSGGAEWGGMSADPNGVLYVNSEDVVWSTAVIDQPAPGPGKSPMHFSGYHKFYDQDGYPATAPPWGTLNAIDMNTGQYLWKIPLGEYPELAAKGLKNTGTENYGGPVTTASGLLFIGATIFDRKFRAFDSATGRLLWEGALPYGGIATPATYMAGGRQYVVIAASGGRDRKGPQGAAYVAFALPQ
jgi:quinoprotein glucose dehydrogenase